MAYLQPCCLGVEKPSSWSCKGPRLCPLFYSKSDIRSLDPLKYRKNKNFKVHGTEQGSRSDADLKSSDVFLAQEKDERDLMVPESRIQNERLVEKYLLYGFVITSCMVAGTGKALADEWYPRRHQQKRLQMKSTLEKWILRVCWLLW